MLSTFPNRRWPGSCGLICSNCFINLRTSAFQWPARFPNGCPILISPIQATFVLPTFIILPILDSSKSKRLLIWFTNQFVRFFFLIKLRFWFSTFDQSQWKSWGALKRIDFSKSLIITVIYVCCSNYSNPLVELPIAFSLSFFFLMSVAAVRLIQIEWFSLNL